MSTQNSIRNKTVAGMSWSAIDSIASQGILFLVGLVLARILSPAEYGLIGMITIFISISNTIVDSGFSNAIIRKPQATYEDYSTAFVFNIALSLLMYGVLFLCSPLIARFFHQEQLIPITRVLGVVVVINSLAIVQKTKLEKEVDFKRQAKISVISSTISGIIGISSALLGAGVWALVAQQISRQLTNAIGLWITAHWKPSFKFSKQSFSYQFSFGWKLLTSELLSTIWMEASNMVIGRCYSSASLGQYSRAKQFSSLFSTNMTAIVQRVSFPVLSSIQEEGERLKASYKKLIKTTMFLSFTGMLALAACARPLIYVLIGEKWEQAAVFLPILCFNFMFYPVRAINTNMLKVVGRSDQLLVLEIIKKTIAIGPLLIGVFVDIYWMLWGNVIAGLIGYVLNSFFSGRFIRYSTLEQILDILPSFLFGGAVALVMFFVSFLGFNYLATLLLQVFIGLCMILLLGRITKMEPYLDIRAIALSYLAKLRRKAK